MMLWASVLNVSDDEGSGGHFDPYQEAAKAAIGILVDWIGLYYAVVHIVLRNISSAHKVQAIGLGK